MTDTLSATALRILAELPTKLEQKIAKQLELDLDTPDDELAERVVSDLNEGQRWALARTYVAEKVGVARRRLARVNEDAAVRVVTTMPARRHVAPTAAPRAVKKIGWVDRPPADIAADPECYSFEFSNRAGRESFKRFMGEYFTPWHDAMRQRVAAGTVETGIYQGAAIDLFDADWHVGGPRDFFATKAFTSMMQFAHDYASEVRLELTSKFLATEFALGDGTKTTWGEATPEQHQSRADLLGRQAAGTAETAGRHLAAIEMINQAGASRLAEVKVA